MKKLVALLFVGILFPALPVFAQAAELKISWTDMSTNEVDFRIERSLTMDTIGFSQVAIVLKDLTTWTDTGLAENTLYFYKMRACNTGGCSPYTAVASGKTVVRIPVAPGAITVTPVP